jgi:hypothetical protein
MALGNIIQQLMALRGNSPAQMLGNMGQAMGMPQPPMNILPPAAQGQMPQRPQDPYAMQLAMQQQPMMQMPMPQMQRPMLPQMRFPNRGPFR